MKLPQGFFKWSRLLAIAMIVVPWFFKDQLAASMDKKAELAQQVLAEKNQQLDIQDQAKDQREVLTRLRAIQGQLDVVQAKAENADQSAIDATEEQSNLDLMSSYFEDEGKALAKSEDTFEGLIDRIDLDPAVTKELEDLAAKASTTADNLRAFDSNPDSKQIDSLYTALNDAHDQLADGYDKLDDAANKERDASASLAGVFRGVAWLCTALGALLMGDWRKLFGGSNEKDAEDHETLSKSRAAPAV
jgi:hypothetical protein